MNLYSKDEVTTADGKSVILNPDHTWEFKGSRERLLASPEWKYVLLYLLVGILGGISFLFMSDYLENRFGKQFWSNLLNELGTALLVAGLLALTIHLVEKRRDQRRFKAEREAIKRDVFEHVFGYRLPEGTFRQLDNQILGARFIRRNFRCSYKLTAHEDKSEKFMKVEAIFTYDIENQTPEEQTFLFETGIENAPVKRMNEAVKFNSVNVKGCKPPINLNTKKEIEQAVRKDLRPNHQVIQEPISIPEFDTAKAVVKFDSFKAFEGGGSFLLYNLQTVGFNLKIEAPSGVEVSADAYFPGKLKEGAEHYPNNDTYNWEFDHPILPFQGVYVTWKSNESQTFSTSQGSTEPDTKNNDSEKLVSNPEST